MSKNAVIAELIDQMSSASDGASDQIVAEWIEILKNNFPDHAELGEQLLSEQLKHTLDHNHFLRSLLLLSYREVFDPMYGEEGCVTKWTPFALLAAITEHNAGKDATDEEIEEKLQSMDCTRERCNYRDSEGNLESRILGSLGFWEM